MLVQETAKAKVCDRSSQTLRGRTKSFVLSIYQSVVRPFSFSAESEQVSVSIKQNKRGIAYIRGQLLVTYLIVEEVLRLYCPYYHLLLDNY